MGNYWWQLISKSFSIYQVKIQTKSLLHFWLVYFSFLFLQLFYQSLFLFLFIQTSPVFNLIHFCLHSIKIIIQSITKLATLYFNKHCQILGEKLETKFKKISIVLVANYYLQQIHRKGWCYTITGRSTKT